MVPLCYRSATVNGLKNPACILHAPFSDIQDANEMRTVENAKRNEERHTGRIRDRYGTIATSIKAYSSTKNTATRNGWRWGLIEKNNNKIALIVFNYSVTRVKL